MKRKCKMFLIFFLIAAAVLLEPVSFVLADETSSGENYERTSFVYANGSKVEFKKKDFFDWFGFSDIPEEHCIQQIIIYHNNLEKVDYSLYEFVCEFELKTLNDDGSITTSVYSHNIDLNHFIVNSFIEDVTSLAFNNIVNNRYDLGTKQFIHQFDYEKIVEKADGFKKRNITGKVLYNTYNTVISRLDLYFVRKSDGEKGRSRRYTFTWDSDFWLQKCTKISFSWYDFSAEYDKEIGSVEDENGVDGYSTQDNDEFLWKDILSFFTDLPSTLVALIVGFIEIVAYISKLFCAVFPFLPPVLFYCFACFILLTIIIAIYKIVMSVT